MAKLPARNIPITEPDPLPPTRSEIATAELAVKQAEYNALKVQCEADARIGKSDGEALARKREASIAVTALRRELGIK
jgi:hypothetical protein